MNRREILLAEDFDSVDWDAVEDSAKTGSKTHNMWLSKHMTGICGVGKWMHRWKHWTEASCPCCGVEIETTRHVVECTSTRMSQHFHECITDLSRWLTAQQTHPNIDSFVIDVLSRRQLGLLPEEVAPDDIGEAVETQNRIGWTALLEGRMAKQWRQTQSNCHKSVGSRKTARSWAANLVSQLKEIAHSMWLKRDEITQEKLELGIRVQEGETMDDRMREQFALGVEGLPEDKKRLIEEGEEKVLNNTFEHKCLWLDTVRSSRAMEAETQESEVAQMQGHMTMWLATTLHDE